MEQRGQFRTGGFNAPWKPFTALQQFTAEPPGFVWDAAIRVVPFLLVRVRDAYLAGAGSMQARIAGLLPVVDQRGRPERTAGALQRYLAEAVWFPTALFPSPDVTREAIDARVARATLTDAGTSVSLEFHLGADGAIPSASTPERFREVAGAYVPTPWTCSYRGYSEVQGMRVPLVAFQLPVTIGNVIGGALQVAIVYWFVFLRERGGKAA